MKIRKKINGAFMGFLLLSFFLIPLTCYCQDTSKSKQYIYTDAQKLPRNYQAQDPIIPVNPAILEDHQSPWEDLGQGLRRKVFFNDRITMVLLEINRPVNPEEKMTAHYHAHEQITYILEGKARVRVGDDCRDIDRGGCYIVPSNVHHAMIPLSEKLVIMDIFTPTREDFRPKTSLQEKTIWYYGFISLPQSQAQVQR